MNSAIARNVARPVRRRDSAAEVGLRFAAVVARGAMAVQHRLHFAVEAEAGDLGPPRLEFGGGCGEGERPAGRWRGVGAFVTTDAREHFAGHRSQPRAHQGERLAIGIERLDGDRRVGRHGEFGGAVFVDGHGAERAVQIPRAILAEDAVESADVIVAEGVGEQPEFLHRAARNPFEARAFIDVLHINRGVLAGGIDLIRDDRRRRTLDDRNRLSRCEPRDFLE